MRATVALALIAACGSPSDDPRAWMLTRAEWDRTVVPEYRPLYDDYTRAFTTARPQLATRAALARPWNTQIRPHFAGDPALTLGEARTRWALPVMYPAFVLAVDGTPLDAVFVRTPRGWGAIVGLDTILVARVAALDAACGSVLETLGSKRCRELGAMVADAALREDRTRLARACALAATACAEPW